MKAAHIVGIGRQQLSSGGFSVGQVVVRPLRLGKQVQQGRLGRGRRRHQRLEQAAGALSGAGQKGMGSAARGQLSK